MTDAASPAESPIRVLTADLTPEEIAAVTAVVQAALDELADSAATESGPAVSAWQRSQRNIRGTLTPGPGAWRGFSG